MELLTHVLDHGREEMEYLGVSCVLSVRLVVVNQEFELWQELLVEDCIGLVGLLENIGLNEL